MTASRHGYQRIFFDAEVLDDESPKVGLETPVAAVDDEGFGLLVTSEWDLVVVSHRHLTGWTGK